MRYTTRLAEAGLSASIGTVGDSYDNALAETVNGLYKAECVSWEGPWAGADDLELATLSWVHWFNHERIHSALNWRPPAEFEQDYHDLVKPRPTCSRWDNRPSIDPGVTQTGTTSDRLAHTRREERP